MKPIHKFIFRLKHFLGLPIPEPNNKHYHNLKNGNTIEINGKKYIKVKLRFVDSMNSDSTTLLLNLETENELLKYELQNLQSYSVLKDQKINDLQILNINLLWQSKEEKKISQIRHQQLQDQNAKLLSELKQLKKENQKLQNIQKKLKVIPTSPVSDSFVNTSKLRQQIKDHKNQLSAKELLCNQKDLLIKTLSDKIIEKEKKIQELSQ